MLRTLLSTLAALLRSRSDLILENLALRQQLAVLQGRLPRRRMSAAGRFFWVALRRLWPKWRQVLVVVRPETVVRWHRLGFRAYGASIPFNPDLCSRFRPPKCRRCASPS